MLEYMFYSNTGGLLEKLAMKIASTNITGLKLFRRFSNYSGLELS